MCCQYINCREIMIRTCFRDLQVLSSRRARQSFSQVDHACCCASRRYINVKGRREKSPKHKRIKLNVSHHKIKRTELKKKDAMFVPLIVEPDKKYNDAEDVGTELAGSLTSAQKAQILKSFFIDASTKMLASSHGIEGDILNDALTSFRKYCISSTQLPVELHIIFRDLVQQHGHVSDLFPFFLSHTKKVFPHLDCMEDLQKISDLTDPSLWYPLARTMQRKIVFHAGPTNSGKTYHALKQFMESNSGVYCGPLRLLAMEVFDKCQEAGVACDLITGETRRYANEDETASGHVACTVEMTSLTNEYDVAVIDEIQMIGDTQRGWSWTRALLGIAAKEVHVCGEETAIDLVQSLLYSTNDTFEVRRYERLTSLTYLDEAVGSFDKIRNGDCIVCFSKKDIFKISNVLITKGYDCALIYGDLPPGTKIAQSRKFNDPDDPTSVLIATDAVGMGLNLAIKRIIFYSLKKISLDVDNTRKLDYLSTSQAQQIGGRAGRFRTQYEHGEVTTFWPKDIKLLHSIVNKEKSALVKAGMHPTTEMIEMFSYHLPKASLSNIIDIFIHVCKLDDSFFMCDLNEFKKLGKMIEHIPLPLRTQCTLCSSPLKINKGRVQVMFVKIATQMSRGMPLTYEWLCRALGAPFCIPKSMAQLEQLEGAFDVVDIYLWLSYRYPDLFVDADEVRQLRLKLDSIIQAYLSKGGRIVRGSVLDDIFEKDSKSEKVSEDLIQHNPLQAYDPKPKPRKESDKHRVFADAYKELERMEEETNDESEYLNDSLFVQERPDGKQHRFFEMNEQGITTENKSDVFKEKESLSKGFLSSDNNLYNRMAGKYASNIQSVEGKNLDSRVPKGEDIDVMSKGETYAGMDEEEVERLKKILTVSKEIKSRNMVNVQSPVMNLKEVKKFANLVSSKEKEPNMNSFVHIYPKKAKVKHKLMTDTKKSEVITSHNEEQEENEVANKHIESPAEESDSDINNTEYDKVSTDLEHRTNASTETKEAESVEDNLLKTGVITEEVLAKLKAEWESSMQKDKSDSKNKDNDIDNK